MNVIVCWFVWHDFLSDGGTLVAQLSPTVSFARRTPACIAAYTKFSRWDRVGRVVFSGPETGRKTGTRVPVNIPILYINLQNFQVQDKNTIEVLRERIAYVPQL